MKSQNLVEANLTIPHGWHPHDACDSDCATKGTASLDASAVRMKLRSGLNALLLLGLIIWGCLSSTDVEAQKQNDDRLVFLAHSRNVEPCERDRSRQCARFYKEDALLKFRISTKLYSGKDEVTNGISRIQLFVTASEIAPFADSTVPLRERVSENLIYPETFGFALASGIPNETKSNLTRSMQTWGRGAGYVESQSYVSGFQMYEQEGCEDYDKTQIDKSLQHHASHPNFKRCEGRFVYFVPQDRNDVWFQCNGRVLQDGVLNPPLCKVESLYSPGLIQSYGIVGRKLLDSSWRELDERLRAFVLSLRVTD